ncbi:NAD-dependent epimerase/dehydratase family protein [Altererythrobacter indicus]|uniref:NAD-dependent epimerase/dehydratase family protein n=1 Tax=Altericroceibacterium indicum TaxID=374177 RepID=A0A845ABE4_9SPHN|nr:NAD-dependent epimerase/dehydratase family protein [Altericroceibacterium indicum]MXP25866.1 NAD-dependent epimerase/dehydratase family protein [Altericroceibacterium indicum]
MSDRPRVLLVGATGLIGMHVIRSLEGRQKWDLIALSRRESSLPKGVRMEMRIAQTGQWPQLIDRIMPDSVICALGTTWAKAGKDEAAFRAVDQGLVLAVADAARKTQARQFVLISSVDADAAAKSFYLRVKGEVEQALHGKGFARLDIIRPGLLRGERGAERRLMERLGIALSPLTDMVLHGDARRYRSISGDMVARAALQLTMEKAAGRFVHQHDDIIRHARQLAQKEC